MSPFAQLASILKSSPGPVGMFLICGHHRTAPFGFGVARDFRRLFLQLQHQQCRPDYCVQDAVGSADFAPEI